MVALRPARLAPLLLLAFLSLSSLFPQQVRYTCLNKKDRYNTIPCDGCPKYYCWDGEIFADAPGYNPPPTYVLQYWAKVEEDSRRLRADIDRKGKELEAAVERGKQETARLNAESAERHKQFMDEVNQKIQANNASRPTSNPPRSSSAYVPPPTQSARSAPPRLLRPEDLPVETGPTAPAFTPVPRDKAAQIKVGMDRAAALEILGKPHSTIAIPDASGLVEILTYTLEGNASANLRIEKSKVASLKITP